MRENGMRIHIDEIPESGRFLHFHWTEERLQGFQPQEDPYDLELDRPVNVDLEIQKRPDHIHIAGTIETVLRVSCHRCLQPFSWELNEKVEAFLVPEEPPPPNDEVELDAEDLEYEFFDGEVIEIDQLVAEQLFLALPVKALCSESCQGICPGCGANLNTEFCQCSEEDESSPFAALKKLKAQLPE